MGTLSRICVAWMTLVGLSVALALQAHAEMTYTVNGKSVSAARYAAWMDINHAVKFLKNNDDRSAIACLRSAVGRDDSLVEAHGMLGLALARSGKTSEAAAELRRSIDLDPHQSIGHLNLASLYESTGELDKAQLEYDHFLVDCPDDKQREAVKERLKLLRAESVRQSSVANAHYTDYLSSTATNGGLKRWSAAAMPLKVYVRPGDQLDSYQPVYDRLLKESFAEWSRASGNKLSFAYTDSPVGADITVTWLEDSKRLSSPAEGGEAQTKSIADALLHSDIFVCMTDKDSVFPVSKNGIRYLCLHEIGHALGLLGHSGSADDVMYCTEPIIDRERHLSARDVTTMKQLYGADVSPLGAIIFDLERRTHGNSVRALQFACGLLAVFATLIVGCVIGLRNKRQRRVKQKRTKS